MSSTFKLYKRNDIGRTQQKMIYHTQKALLIGFKCVQQQLIHIDLRLMMIKGGLLVIGENSCRILF